MKEGSHLRKTQKAIAASWPKVFAHTVAMQWTQEYLWLSYQKAGTSKTHEECKAEAYSLHPFDEWCRTKLGRQEIKRLHNQAMTFASGGTAFI